jgi:hypothetical protein
MGVFGLRMDIFIIIWFLAMGMVNFLDAESELFSYTVDPRYSVSDVADWQGIRVGDEKASAEGMLEPRSQPSENTFGFFDTFVYVYKAVSFFVGVLWNASFGFHTYLRDAFGIGYMPWGLPLMILINLMNVLGLIELWTKVKP